MGWLGTGWNNPKPAQGALGLVQDFVNTRNYLQGGDLLGGVGEADRRLAERGLLGAGEGVGELGRQRLVAFREALRGLLLAHNGVGGPGVEGLNELVADVSLGVSFSSDGRPVLGPTGGEDPAACILARLLAEVFRAEAEGKWGRLKACGNPDCLWIFYDSSKNGLGRWCDMQLCGARHKMRRYRERQRSGEA
ncbi:MAG TPA: CGNR zinc finger domain-containing protein [Rubrobacter sp.]|nr:CGNR zinc finger domain-containing protein [Rubrobacter sp.]